MNTHSHHQPRRGFTLVELLVVIAIVATLAGIVLVVVRSTMASSAAARTSKNMKEIYSAMTILQTEGVNTGFHAPNTFPPFKGSLQDAQQASFIWWDLVAEQLSFAERDGANFRWQKAYSDTALQNPLSEKVLGLGKTEYNSLQNDPDLSHGGYSYNAVLGGDVSNNAAEEMVYKVRLSAVKDGSTTIYFAEADDEQTTPGWVFRNIEDAPQGNYKDKVHCCMVGGNVELIENQHLKDPKIFAFYTSIENKNYSDKP